MKPDVSIIPEKEEVQLDPQRCFTPNQRARLFERAKGRCEVCGCKIRGKWIAGHYPVPHSHGGRTEVVNGRVECLECGETTHKDDTKSAAKNKRRAGKTGQRARREKRGGSSIVSGNSLTNPKFKRKVSGETVRRKPCQD